jgi:hypothetical protein
MLALQDFYEPTTEILRGLGQMYVDAPRFAAVYRKVHSNLPGFFNQAIQYYCDHLKE